MVMKYNERLVVIQRNEKPEIERGKAGYLSCNEARALFSV